VCDRADTWVRPYSDIRKTAACIEEHYKKELKNTESMSLEYIDTHAHLNDPAFDSDLEAVLERARAAGVTRIVNVGADDKTSVKALEQAARHDCLRVTVGLHPHEASHFTDSMLAFFDSLAADSRVVAIGETGLDYHYMHSPREAQLKSLEAQLDLADSLSLPAVLHCREAYPEMASLLEERAARGHHAPWMVHCYAGTLEELERFIALDCWFSLGGMVTFRNYSNQAVVRRIPADRLLLETDAPYLAPIPHRGGRCEPWMLPISAERIAQIRGEKAEAVAAACLENSTALFEFTA